MPRLSNWSHPTGESCLVPPVGHQPPKCHPKSIHSNSADLSMTEALMCDLWISLSVRPQKTRFLDFLQSMLLDLLHWPIRHIDRSATECRLPQTNCCHSTEVLFRLWPELLGCLQRPTGRQRRAQTGYRSASQRKNSSEVRSRSKCSHSISTSGLLRPQPKPKTGSSPKLP